MTQAAQLHIEVAVERRALRAPVRLSFGVLTEVALLVVTLRRGDAMGQGEAAGVLYLDDTPEHGRATIEERRAALASISSRQELQTLLPPGGARNAVDCALWALEANEQGTSIAALAGVPNAPLLTTFTLGADDPDTMARVAVDLTEARALKLKLTGDATLDAARVRAVRAARADVWIGVDANQGYRPETLPDLFSALIDARVALLEQPLPRGREPDMMPCPVPTAADESCQDLTELEALVGRFEAVNIKLDKCGGLTEALAMAARARVLGLGVMVGNMIGTSLAMIPAMAVGQLCDIVDLDGPLALREDRAPSVRYHEGKVWPPASASRTA